jgi:hypothetical protein
VAYLSGSGQRTKEVIGLPALLIRLVGHSGRAFGMRVQAKRIKLPSERFRNIAYRSKGASLNQIETLIRSARANHTTPLYCLYVHSCKYPKGIWPSRRQPATAGRYEGCMVAHASLIQRAKSNKLIPLQRILEPWHSLVCPGAGIRTEDLANIAHATVAALSERFAGLLIDAHVEEGGRPFVSEVRSTLPGYVTEALASGRYPDRDEVPPQGVIVIRQV